MAIVAEEMFTDAQKQVVNHIDGPLLVLAGPGSGKTRVVTHRIARLLSLGVCDYQILAITFTNKASEEMASRVAELVPHARVQISTFHKFCSRLLRKYAPAVGLQTNFSILDTTDQKRVIKRILHDLDLDATHYPPPRILNAISKAKNDLITAPIYVERNAEFVSSHFEAVVARVYPAYQKMLLELNAVDFDDLLLHVVEMLEDSPELRKELDERFQYVLVDEYQDTNMAQYKIITALSQHVPNLCVTGDPDQSIYGWRGAQISNILRFENDFPNTKTVRLEQNFRSTKSILKVADELISHNQHRKQKSLHTENEQGADVEMYCFTSHYEEAESIACHIRNFVEADSNEKLNWSDFAILYRVNALSRALELSFRRNNIPYQLAGGSEFYSRTEVKDALSYLHLIANPSNDEAFLRIVNKPLRGIGQTSQNRLRAWRLKNGGTLLEACKKANEVPKLTKRAAFGFQKFAENMRGYDFTDYGSVGELLKNVLEQTFYIKQFQGSSNEDDQQRLENLEELIASARHYDEVAGDERSLEGFLETTALISDVDRVDDESGKVTMMSLHAAKGLEFPVVFVIGLEENLIPHERALLTADQNELEEERRLLFVGMTRAEKQLYLTQSKTRDRHGQMVYTIPSSFVREMELEPKEVIASDFYSSITSQSSAISANVVTEKKKPKAKFPKLMTAADLASGKPIAAEMPIGFPTGSMVRHPRYGLGQVVSVNGFGPRRTVTVEFEDAQERKTFVMANCPLQPVG